MLSVAVRTRVDATLLPDAGPAPAPRHHTGCSPGIGLKRSIEWTLPPAAGASSILRRKSSPYLQWFTENACIELDCTICILYHTCAAGAHRTALAELLMLGGQGPRC